MPSKILLEDSSKLLLENGSYFLLDGIEGIPIQVLCAKNITIYGKILSTQKISFADCCGMKSDGPPEEFIPGVRICDTTVKVCGTSYDNLIDLPITTPIIPPVINAKYTSLAIKDDGPITYECLNWEDFSSEFLFDQVTLQVNKNDIKGHICQQMTLDQCCFETPTLPTHCTGVTLSKNISIQISKLNAAAQNVIIVPVTGYPTEICCPTDVNVNPPPAKCYDLSPGKLDWFPFIRNGGYYATYAGNTGSDTAGCTNYIFVESTAAVTAGRMDYYINEIGVSTTTTSYYLTPGDSYITITTPNYTAYTGKLVNILRVPCDMNYIIIGGFSWYSNELAFSCSNMCYDTGISGLDISAPDLSFLQIFWEYSQQWTYFMGDPWYGTYPPSGTPDPDPARVGLCIHPNPFQMRMEIWRQIEIQFPGTTTGNEACCFLTEDIPGDGVTLTRYGYVKIIGTLVRRITGERDEDLLIGYPWDGSVTMTHDIKRSWVHWPGPASGTSPINQIIKYIEGYIYEDPAIPGYYRSAEMDLTLTSDPECPYPLTSKIKIEVTL